MLILQAKKTVITQTDWLKITAERARMQTGDGKIIINEKYEKKKFLLDESKIYSNNIINVFVRRYVHIYK